MHDARLILLIAVCVSFAGFPFVCFIERARHDNNSERQRQLAEHIQRKIVRTTNGQQTMTSTSCRFDGEKSCSRCNRIMCTCTFSLTRTTKCSIEFDDRSRQDSNDVQASRKRSRPSMSMLIYRVEFGPTTSIMIVPFQISHRA
jgi:hypothetical protein